MPEKFFGQLMTLFQRKVYNITKKIKPGCVLSYKEVAAAAGSPLAWRAVGSALNKNPRPFILHKSQGKQDNSRRVPCHRVIKSDGSLGGFRRDLKIKIALLKKEGVEVK